MRHTCHTKQMNAATKAEPPKAVKAQVVGVEPYDNQ